MANHREAGTIHRDPGHVGCQSKLEKRERLARPLDAIYARITRFSRTMRTGVGPFPVASACAGAGDRPFPPHTRQCRNRHTDVWVFYSGAPSNKKPSRLKRLMNVPRFSWCKHWRDRCVNSERRQVRYNRIKKGSKLYGGAS